MTCTLSDTEIVKLDKIVKPSISPPIFPSHFLFQSTLSPFRSLKKEESTG